jgi:hypothetical protein
MDSRGKKLAGLSYFVAVALCLSIKNVRETPELWLGVFFMTFPLAILVAYALWALIELFKALEKWIEK